MLICNETVKKTSEAVGKGIMYAGAVLGLAIGSLGLN